MRGGLKRVIDEYNKKEYRIPAQVLAIIPCRSGSKGIPHKNIQPLLGKPLLAHSIECALSSSLVTRTIVSTDSAEYADIAKRYGAEVPFLRPIEISGDYSTDLEVFVHALDWFKKNEDYCPDICLHLRPTYPVRKVEDVDRIIRLLIEQSDIDSVRTIVPSEETPYKMWRLGSNNILVPVLVDADQESYNLPRQLLPTVYFQNACIDAVRTRVILLQRSMTGKRIYGYIMDHNYDIDTTNQLEKLRKVQDHSIQSEEQDHTLIRKGGTFCFDIDGVIATIEPGNNYSLAKPISDGVSVVNRLYEQGHRIVLYTARGSATGMDWEKITRSQMEEWGVKHHKLIFGKPAADYYIDDRMISLGAIRKYIEQT